MSFMLDEIFEQPNALRRTFNAERAHAVDFQKTARAHRFRLIVLVARGTSDNAALFGRYLLELTTGIPVSLCAPSIYTLYRAELDLRGALVVGISQSGESTDVNEVLKSAGRQGAFTIGITNQSQSPMARVVRELFQVRAGRQRSVAATKTYTGQLLLFYLLASALGSSITVSSVSEIADRVKETLALEAELRELAERYRFMRQCVVVARGLNYANAFELSLKLMETCYVVAERFSSADFLHGPIAMIQRDIPVMLFMPPGPTFQDLSKLARRLRGMKTDTLVISSADLRVPQATRVIRVPSKIPEIYTPIPYIVPGQLLAALLAEIRGLNPDKPRFLQMVTRTM